MFDGIDGFNARLQARVEVLGLSRTGVVESIGLAPSTFDVLSVFCSTQYPSADMLVSLSNLLQCSVDWLLTGEAAKPLVETVEVPFLDKHDELDFSRKLSLPISFVAGAASDDGESVLACFTLKTNKCAPIFMPGDVIIVDTSVYDSMCEDNYYAYRMQDGRIMIYRCVWCADGVYLLSCDGGEKVPVRKVLFSKLLGRVVSRYGSFNNQR